MGGDGSMVRGMGGGVTMQQIEYVVCIGLGGSMEGARARRSFV